jgi:hypothetical protein
MNTDQIAALLTAERDRLNRAIEALQGSVPVKRRGRPPKNASAVAAAPLAPALPSTPIKKQRSFTAAQRKAQSEKLRAYWKKRKAAETKG